MFISDAWPTTVTYHRPFHEFCCPRSRVRRFIDTCRGRVCSPAVLCRLAPAYWLRCASLLLKSRNTRYPCPVSEAKAPVCPTWYFVATVSGIFDTLDTVGSGCASQVSRGNDIAEEKKMILLYCRDDGVIL